MVGHFARRKRDLEKNLMKVAAKTALPQKIGRVAT
jgi:hypothetical protein